MTSTHRYASCRCGWHVEEPSQAEQERHATDGHAPTQREHPRQFCNDQCTDQRRAKP